MPDGTQILNTAVLSSKDENGVDYTSGFRALSAAVGEVSPTSMLRTSQPMSSVRWSSGVPSTPA